MITKYIQQNGLTVLLEPVSSVASVSVGLWLKTGSRMEQPDQYGYAHFVEHMLFKGTKQYSAQDIARNIDRVGGQHNAATNREYTCYYINVISDHLDLAIKILADMYYNSLLDADELEKEKNVILEEIRMYDDTPDELIHDIFLEKMLEGHTLSHSILGTSEGITAVSRGSLNEFYRNQYRDDRAVFVIAGDFELENAKDLTARYFDGSACSDDLKIQTEPAVAFKPVHHHEERDLEQIHFCLGSDGFARDDDDRWGLYTLSTILGGSMSSRLFQKIREERGLTYSVYSFHSSFSDRGLFGIYSATSPDNFNLAASLAVEECRKLFSEGITEEELQDAKTFMKGNLALSYESIEVRMGQMAKNEMTFGRHYSFDEIVSSLDAITMEDFMRVAARLFSDRTLSLIFLGKTKEKSLAPADLHILA